jgi:excisionase family DNA binding protein
MSEAYLTPLDAAKYVCLSVSTLAKLRVYGGGPVFVRIGRSVRYRRADVDDYMQARLATSTSSPIPDKSEETV